MIQKPVTLHSVQSERHALSSVVKYPEIYPEIESFVKEQDFDNGTHAIIYRVVKNSFSQKEQLNAVLLAAKIKNLGINKFENDLDIEDYINSLYTLPVKKEDGPGHFKTIVNLRIRRDINNLGAKIAEEARSPKNESMGSLITSIDKLYSEAVRNSIQLNESKCVNLFESMEDLIEGIGNNPPDPNKYPMGPFPLLHSMIGSLHRKGNITLYAARSGVGKTNFMFYMNVFIAEKYGLPIYWNDVGELSKEELQLRAASCLSEGRVPMFAVEDGSWRKNKEYTKIIRDLWPRVKKLKLYYEDVSDMGPNDIISAARRFSFNIAGRNNDFIWCIDYLKPFDDTEGESEWRQFGKYVKALKSFIQNEINVNLQTGIQSNRSGISNGKNSKFVDNSENSVSQDRVSQQASNIIILRRKTFDEIERETTDFGNMKLYWNAKTRHLGKDVERALNYIKNLDGIYEPNFLNIDCNNFHYVEMGDGKQMYEKLQDQHDIQGGDSNKDDMSGL